MTKFFILQYVSKGKNDKKENNLNPSSTQGGIPSLYKISIKVS